MAQSHVRRSKVPPTVASLRTRDESSEAHRKKKPVSNFWLVDSRGTCPAKVVFARNLGIQKRFHERCVGGQKDGSRYSGKNVNGNQRNARNRRMRAALASHMPK